MLVKDIADDPIPLAVVESIRGRGGDGQAHHRAFAQNGNILRRLRAVGVDYDQGYGVGPPRPLDELNAAAGSIPGDKSPG